MLDFNYLKKNLKKDISTYRRVKLAVLGDTATQFITQAIKGMGVEYALNMDLYEADFNQISRQIFDPASDLYRFNPEFTFIFESSHTLLQKFSETSPADRVNFAEKSIVRVKEMLAALQNKSDSKIIFCNYTEEDDHVFGHFASKAPESFPYQLRLLNVLLQEFAGQTANLFICDLSSLQNAVGRERFWSPSIYINTEMVVSIDVLPYVAKAAIQIILAVSGAFKKCIIIDLDNTLWGGIIGDDGMENIQIGQLGIGKAFTEFQLWLKKMQQRGIILAVCSKNTESVAKEPFEKHPDMILRLSDIAVFIANWDNKPDNIRRIQKILNIGFDSMVFLDDSAFERNMVRENIPQITIPDLPEDPALYLDYLYSLNLFETASCSVEDAKRTAHYQKEAERTTFQERFTNEDDFLRSLDMQSEIKSFDAFTFPRVAQLSQRSNQFNLRTVRYTEDQIKNIAQSNNYFTLSFTLEDKFGDNGLICAVILEKCNNKTLFIDTWFMSCRVLKRSVENYVLNAIVELANANGYIWVEGEYIATPKNEMVREHYKNLGFTLFAENCWRLDIEGYEMKKNFIKKK
jgi:FkbH-like protein